MPQHQDVILLIHGMGKHKAPSGSTRGSFGKEFLDSTTTALQRYPAYEDRTLEDYVDIVEFNYDGWLDKVRKKMSETAKTMKQRVAAIAKIPGAAKLPANLAGELASLEAEYGEDDFFYTHWLDVVFYASVMGGRIRVDCGKAINQLIHDYGSDHVHVFAHSLGTAVAHDTLALMYRPESDPFDEIPDLRPEDQKLRSVWTVANVSRLLYAVTRLSDPLKSLVRPGPGGGTIVFNNVRHQLDPFTWISRFWPPKDGAWIPEPVHDQFYVPVLTDLVTDANTHAITQYLEDPLVAEALFSQLIPGFAPTPAERQDARAEYSKGSIQGAYALLKQEFSDLDVKDLSSWKDFFEAAKNLQKAIELIKGELK